MLSTPFSLHGLLQTMVWLLLLLGLMGVVLGVLIRRRAAQAKFESAQSDDFSATRAMEPSGTVGIPAAPKVRRRTHPSVPPAPPTTLPPPVPTIEPTVRPQAWGLEVFSVIEWRRFEALVEALFAQAGFVTRSQSHGADGGVDIWLHSRHQPDGSPVSIVQCKHWQSGKPVGVDKIRELRGVMAAHNVHRGQFACTAHYSTDAREFARTNQIHLLDGPALLALIAKRTPEQQQALLDVALDGEYWKPTCVKCDTKMVLRTPRNGGKHFWGCVNNSKCKGMMVARG
ncbi:restriction endonuclease [Leptothrix ochracea L12]|uniref:Restriction endonuclease n=1 Tax=Leptothrix ochracea L12 TaxID=735332 RepID=I4Z5F8_9BURK|nr:restriction endonuclease [Leptothrix ochracea]EIM31450.1 restriction endonuclease [Leptothrix ochracea L12]